jgi:hypothetical protein
VPQAPWPKATKQSRVNHLRETAKRATRLKLAVM